MFVRLATFVCSVSFVCNAAAGYDYQSLSLSYNLSSWMSRLFSPTGGSSSNIQTATLNAVAAFERLRWILREKLERTANAAASTDGGDRVCQWNC